MKYLLCFLVVTSLSLVALSQGGNALVQANLEYKNGHFQQALTALEMPARNEEEEAAMYMLRGDCLQKMGQFSQALEQYDTARIHGYEEDDLLLHRGICKISLGFYEAARFDLNAYIQRNTEDAKAYYWMATLEYLCLENRTCLRYIDETIYLDSAYADAYYLRGACYASQNKSLMALDDFRTAYELNPKMERAKLNMSILLIDMGQFDEAVEMLSELCLQTIDFTAEVLYYRGEAHYSMHDLDGACRDWGEAASMGDADAQVSHNRICLDSKGKPRFKQRKYVQF